jgi:superoxide dismutase, Cu-Zn family
MMRRTLTAMLVVFALAASAAARADFGQSSTSRSGGAKSGQASKGQSQGGRGSHGSQGGRGEHGAHKMEGRETMRARADIRGEKITGEAEFVEMEHDGGQRVLHVTVRVKGDPAVLKPGLHGVHLHQSGVCEAPFTSAGGHFDPGPAANNDPDANHPFHMGDLPNIRIGADGSGTLRAVTTRATLSDGPLTLFDADGSAIIIHGNEDKMITGAPKSGVSGGPRVACGVVRKM